MVGATKGTTERAVLLALATSGLRRAEALGLDWRRVDLQAKQLHVHGKGDKDRPVVTFADLLASLHALRAQQGLPTDGPVFRGRQGRPLQKSTLQRWLNRWLGDAGLRTDGRNALTLHSLRRFAAKQRLDNGLNIRQVQLLLGHEDLQTTMLYLDYTAEDLHAAAERVNFGLGHGDTEGTPARRGTSRGGEERSSRDALEYTLPASDNPGRGPAPAGRRRSVSRPLPAIVVRFTKRAMALPRTEVREAGWSPWARTHDTMGALDRSSQLSPRSPESLLAQAPRALRANDPTNPDPRRQT